MDRRKAEEPAEAAGAAPEREEAQSPPAPAKARSAPAEKKAASAGNDFLPFGYVLTLKSPGDSANLFAGLRAMGVRYKFRGGDPGLRQYFLFVPAPMLRELAPYLLRYGKVLPQGRRPAARTDSVLVRLRLSLPLP